MLVLALLPALGSCYEPPSPGHSASAPPPVTAAVSGSAAPLTAAQPATAQPADSGSRCPAGMLFIPGGDFAMGSPPGVGEDDERPRHRRRVGAFCLQRTEVTVAQYRECVRDGRRCSPAKDDVAVGCNSSVPTRRAHPINCVSWAQAQIYCRWAGGRLPGEAEWEYAAGGGQGRIYPWGNEPPDVTRLNVCGTECSAAYPGWPPMFPASDGWPETAPVGSFPAGRSALGLLDLAGNVWEWTADWHLPYEAPALASSGGRSSAARTPPRGRVVRGGGWRHNLPVRVRVANRHSYAPTEQNAHLGIRCAADPH